MGTTLGMPRVWALNWNGVLYFLGYKDLHPRKEWAPLTFDHGEVKWTRR